MEIRRSYDRLISTMGFPILARLHLYIESGPRLAADVQTVMAIARNDRQRIGHLSPTMAIIWYCLVPSWVRTWNSLVWWGHETVYSGEDMKQPSEDRWMTLWVPMSVLTHLPQGRIYMQQWTVSTLVQVLSCRLLGAKPLPEPMLTYCQLDPWEQTSVKFNLKF